MKRHMKDSILPVELKSEMSSVGSTVIRVRRHTLGAGRFNFRNEQVDFDIWAEFQFMLNDLTTKTVQSCRCMTRKYEYVNTQMDCN